MVRNTETGRELSMMRRGISDKQLELRSRLEVLDRKVTAILRDALEQRRLR